MNRHYKNIEVPRILMKFIIGKKRQTANSIEVETRTRIQFSNKGQYGDVLVAGSNSNDVKAALERIMSIIAVSRDKIPFSHFLSLKASENIHVNFIKFRDQVLESCSDDKGVSSIIFQKPEKLHLTLGLCVLLDSVDEQAIIDEVNSFKRTNPGYFTRPLNISIKGLNIMNEDPSKVKVLYGKVVENEDSVILQDIANSLTESFIKKKLTRSNTEPIVKLHLTLLNMSYVYRNQDEDVKAEPINCVNILQKFRDFEFGTIFMDKFDLLLMSDDPDNGYYLCIKTFEF